MTVSPTARRFCGEMDSRLVLQFSSIEVTNVWDSSRELPATLVCALL